MFEYIKGKISDLAPTFVVVENNGIGYFVNISLTTYSELSNSTECKLYIYEAIREDAHLLYGFLNKSERELFLLLISVSGVGANTARMMLSSVSSSELQEAIATENVLLLKSIKGIGIKTAQRIIVDLKDKVVKNVSSEDSSLSINKTTARNESVSALVMLGFQQSASQKVVDKILSEQPSLTVEQTIKLALKML